MKNDEDEKAKQYEVKAIEEGEAKRITKRIRKRRKKSLKLQCERPVKVKKKIRK